MYKNENAMFFQWMINNWTINGGLITQADAAELIGVTRGRIPQMIKEGKIKEIRYKNKSFVSYAEVMKIALDKNMKELPQEIEKEMETLPESMKEKFMKEFMKEVMPLIKETIPAMPETESETESETEAKN